MYGIKFGEIKSTIDMCEWLHDIGWRSPCDAQWEKIKPLYERLAQLEAENARLREVLTTARYWLTGISNDIYGDDFGDFLCSFSDDEVDRLEAFLATLSEGEVTP